MEDVYSRYCIEIGTLDTTCYHSDHVSYRVDSPIYPYQHGDPGFWDIKTVSLFLNSLENFLPTERSRHVSRAKEPYTAMKFVHSENPEIYVRFSFHYLAGRIELSVSSQWLTKDWILKRTTKMSRLGTRGRDCVLESMKTLERFSYYVYISNDTQIAIFTCRSPIFYSIDDFSSPFKDFVHNFLSNDKSSNFTGENLDFINEFYKTWIKNSRQYDKIKTREQFFQNTEGFIKFVVSEQNEADKQHQIMIDGKNYSILRGIYLSPFAKSIMGEKNKNYVDGLLMDTTWHVINNYVTSILMVSVCNVGLPLGFSFGPSEDKAQYEMFYNTFSEEIGVPLDKFTVESDRGTALRAIVSEKGSVHLGCLHHLLRSIKSSEFSHQIGSLVACKCKIDLDILLNTYEEEFSKFIDTPKMSEINRGLASCGLVFDKISKKIKINDTKTWDEVSQIERIKYKMPSTTNALESSHGHLNEKITRRNDFYTSLVRLTKFTVSKAHNFEHAFQTNFARTKRAISRRNTEFYWPIIDKEIVQYHTTLERCECGETKLLSSMMRIDIPCSHQLRIGKEFPECPVIKLEISNNFKELKVKYEEQQRTGATSKKKLEEALSEKAVFEVRKRSKCKNKSLIMKSLNPVYVEGETQFANGMPKNFFVTVSDGVHIFKDPKK